MKLKKWGALLLALYMIVTVLPTTAMASENPVAGPDAEKYEFALLDYGEEYSPDKELSGISVNVNDRSEYYLYLVNTNADGTKTPVDTDLYDLACELPNGAQNALVKAYQDDDFYRVSVIGINEANENLTLKATLTETSESVTETVALEVNDTGSYPDFSLAVYGIEFYNYPGYGLQNLETETPYQVSVVGTRDDGSYFVLDSSLYTIDIQIAKGTYAFGRELHQLDDSYAFDISGMGDTREYDSVVVHAEGAFGSADLTCPINVKAIENDFVVQLPSADEMIGTSPNWLAVTSEPAWDGTILDVVNVAQRFYDSTGKEMTKADTFQNNSRYTMEMTFQSFDYYYGDYYYVLSGDNEVYADIFNSDDQSWSRNALKTTAGTDVNGNPVIAATYSFSIGTPPDSTYEWVLSRWDDPENTPLDEVTVVIGQPVKYKAQVIETLTDGTKAPVSTDLINLKWGNIYAANDIDVRVTTYDTSYMLAITANTFERPDDLNLGTENVGYKPGVFAAYNLKVLEPTEIEVNKIYNVSDKEGQDLHYIYQPTEDTDETYRSYMLWTGGGTVEGKSFGGIGAGKNIYQVFNREGTDPVNFQFSPTTNNAKFELVESKHVTKIEFLSVPENIIQDIRENGEKANLNGFTFKVTYRDGSTRTYEYSGTKDEDYFVYHMDWTPDGNVYDCGYNSEKNTISLLGACEPGAWISENYQISDETKVNITEGLKDVTGNLEDTEYNTIEKIENKLTETIASNKGYTADNTAIYDIEFVTSKDGGETWIPVTAEDFPKEGIEVTLPYPEGTNAADYDFTVVHMFDEDVNGHKAGEVETPEATEGENGISFRLMGTSPVMVGYKKAAAAHTHSYGEWTDCKDGINHQRSCSCGDVQKEAHAWDNGIITKEATKDAEGIKTYSCKTCGAAKTESIPKLTSDTTPSQPGDSANPSTDTTSPKTGDSANIALWIIVMLASAAGLSCTYFVRRKTKSDL